MNNEIVYATGDDFKWRERRYLAKKFGIEMSKHDRIDLGRRIEMMDSIEDAVLLKWRLGISKVKDWLMVDMNDVLIDGRLSWYKARTQEGVSMDEFVSNLWYPINEKTADLVKVGLKNVIAIGKKGQSPVMTQFVLDGIIMYRPPQKKFSKLPRIVPYVFVSSWQEMLDQFYLTKFDQRSSSHIPHDGKNLIQVLARVGML